MRHNLLAVAALTAFALPAFAQRESTGPVLEIRSFAGAYLPMGAQRDDFKSTVTIGSQLAAEITDHFHLVGTLAVTDGRNRFTNFNDNRTYIWDYGLGGEVNGLHRTDGEWLVHPFLGFGLGARTYAYSATNVGTYTCAASYGSAGLELQRGVIGARIDARDYVTCFKSPIHSRNETRNDVSATLGLVYHIR